MQLTVQLGPQTSLTLPCRDPAAPDDATDPVVAFAPPEHAAPVGHEEPHDSHRFRHDHGRGETRTTIVYEGRTELPADGTGAGLVFGDRQRDDYLLRLDDPLSARLEHHAERHMRRGSWEVRVVVDTSVSADATHFTVTSARDAYEGAVRVHALRRSVRIPRDGV